MGTVEKFHSGRGPEVDTQGRIQNVESPSASPLDDFAERLRNLRLAAGQPSYADLARARPTLARSTVSDVLNAKRAPGLDLVLDFVSACTVIAEKRMSPLPSDLASREKWQTAWAALRRSIREPPTQRPPAATVQLPSKAHLSRDRPPRQLPGLTMQLVGRDAIMASLDSHVLSRTTGGDGETCALIVLEGPPGIGKSALAIAWGHARAEHYPDGQLFCDLGGFGPGPARDTSAVLRYLVHSLGETTAHDPDESTLAATWRTVTTGRRLLVVLDNAANAIDVRRLLPGGSQVTVLVTTRGRLAGLSVTNDAMRVPLVPLNVEDSEALLRVVGLGEGYSSAQLVEVAHTCGGLPLALRIAAVRLVTGLPLGDLLDTDEADDASSLRNVFWWSLSALSPLARTLFLLCGSLPTGRVSMSAASALTGSTAAATRKAIAALCNASLLDGSEEEGYRMHDLLRAYASEQQVEELSPYVAREARLRLIHWYRRMAYEADCALLPARTRPAPPVQVDGAHRFTSYEEALRWFESELPAFALVAEMAVAVSEPLMAVDLAVTLLGYFNLRKPWSEWLSVFKVAAAAAASTGDPGAVASTCNGLGIAWRELNNDKEAIACFERALREYLRAGDVGGASMVENNLGVLHNERGRATASHEHYARALRYLSATDDPWRTAIVAHNLAEADVSLGFWEQALTHAQQAQDLCVSVNDDAGVAAALTTLGAVHQAMGELERAIGCFGKAARMQQQRGELQAMAISRRRLGQALLAAGSDAAGRAELEVALSTLQKLGDPLAQAVSSDLDRLTSPLGH